MTSYRPGSKSSGFAFIVLSMCFLTITTSAHAGPFYPGGALTPQKRLDWLQKRVRAKTIDIEEFCVERALPKQVVPEATNNNTPALAECKRRSLDNTRKKLAEVKSGERKRFRVLHLGDSHNASDLITGTIRLRLQDHYGKGGDGFSHADQPWGFGGRRRKRASHGWFKDRSVDGGKKGRPYGFSWVSLESLRKNASVLYQVQPYDEEVSVYYYAQKRGGTFALYLTDDVVGDELVGEIDTNDDERSSKVARFNLSAARAAIAARKLEKESAQSSGLEESSKKKSAKKKAQKKKKGPRLKLVAKGKRARFFGIDFSRAQGLLYDSIGPVGADAQLYLDMNQESFAEHLKELAPDLVVLMVGGNDAMKVRKRWLSLRRIKGYHEKVVDMLRENLPDVDVMIWTPMDSGIRYGESRRIYSKRKVPEVRALQQKVAAEKGAALWDLYAAMGGKGSMARWYYAGSMSGDLVHPRRAAGDLIGMLFSDAFMRAVGEATAIEAN